VDVGHPESSAALDSTHAACSLSLLLSASSQKLQCYTAAAPSPSPVWARGMCHSDTGSRQNKNFADHCGNTSASETSRAKAEQHQQPNSTVFLHFDNWPRISGKAASRAQPDRTAQSFKCSLESLAFKFCIHLHAVSRGSENRNAVSFCKQNARN
jgi:hypothetical protein